MLKSCIILLLAAALYRLGPLPNWSSLCEQVIELLSSEEAILAHTAATILAAAGSFMQPHLHEDAADDVGPVLVHLMTKGPHKVTKTAVRWVLVFVGLTCTDWDLRY